MTDVNNVKSHQVAAFFDAPNAYGNMRGLARSLPAAFDQGMEKFKQTIREAVARRQKVEIFWQGCAAVQPSNPAA